MKTLYILLAVLIAFLSLTLFVGCSYEVRVPDKTYIPVKCTIQLTTPPYNVAKDSTDYLGIKANNDSILIYSEVIKSDLNACTSGTYQIKGTNNVK